MEKDLNATTNEAEEFNKIVLTLPVVFIVHYSYVLFKASLI